MTHLEALQIAIKNCPVSASGNRIFNIALKKSIVLFANLQKADGISKLKTCKQLGITRNLLNPWTVQYNEGLLSFENTIAVKRINKAPTKLSNKLKGKERDNVLLVLSKQSGKDLSELVREAKQIKRVNKLLCK